MTTQWPEDNCPKPAGEDANNTIVAPNQRMSIWPLSLLSSQWKLCIKESRSLNYSLCGDNWWHLSWHGMQNRAAIANSVLLAVEASLGFELLPDTIKNYRSANESSHSKVCWSVFQGRDRPFKSIWFNLLKFRWAGTLFVKGCYLFIAKYGMLSFPGYDCCIWIRVHIKTLLYLHIQLEWDPLPYRKKEVQADKSPASIMERAWSCCCCFYSFCCSNVRPSEQSSMDLLH